MYVCRYVQTQVQIIRTYKHYPVPLTGALQHTASHFRYIEGRVVECREVDTRKISYIILLLRTRVCRRLFTL